ncbi:hypothetical protein KAU08_03905, partial [bacterium]|nr:hypothetical protein [bacterium]
MIQYLPHLVQSLLPAGPLKPGLVYPFVTISSIAAAQASDKCPMLEMPLQPEAAHVAKMLITKIERYRNFDLTIHQPPKVLCPQVFIYLKIYYSTFLLSS